MGAGLQRAVSTALDELRVREDEAAYGLGVQRGSAQSVRKTPNAIQA